MKQTLHKNEKRENTNVGDLNSNALGSAARKNEGKPDYSLIFSGMLKSLIDDKSVYPFLDKLDMFMKFPTKSYLSDCIAAGQDLLQREIGGVEYSVYDSMICVFEYGTEKYAKYNWCKGFKWSVPIACIHRHILKQYAAFGSKEYADVETNEPHLAHVLANLLMLDLFMETYPEGNDMPGNLMDFPVRDKTEAIFDGAGAFRYPAYIR